MGPHCTVRPEHALAVALTLEPIKMSMYNIHSAACPSGCYWQSGLSHLQRRCHCTFLGGSFELCSPVDSLWHFGRRVSGIAFAFSQLLRAMVQFPPFWEGFQTISSGLESEPGWLFVAHYCHFGRIPLNCCW